MGGALHNISFGSLLREARISKGYELQEAARGLRIRPDILQAIENSDFERMPPRGYSRNMVSAYAKFLGLNPQELTRLYLDQAYAFQIGQAYQSANQNVEMQRRSREINSSSRSTDQSTSRFQQTTSRRTRADGEVVNGRRHYSQEDLRSSAAYQSSSARQRVQSRQNAQSERQQVARQRTPNLHPSRHPAITEGKYLNLYAQQDHAGRLPKSRIPKPLIFGVIAIIIIIAIIVFAVSSCTKQPEQTNIPVTGLENVESTEQQPPAEQPPTEFTLEYSLEEGTSAWIEVYIDGERQEAGEVEGPTQQSYSSSTDIQFVCGSLEGVSLTVNGEPVELEANDSGIVNITYEFQDILDQWYEAHPDAAPQNTSTTDESGDAESTGSQTNARQSRSATDGSQNSEDTSSS